MVTVHKHSSQLADFGPQLHLSAVTFANTLHHEENIKSIVSLSLYCIPWQSPSQPLHWVLDLALLRASERTPKTTSYSRSQSPTALLLQSDSLKHRWQRKTQRRQLGKGKAIHCKVVLVRAVQWQCTESTFT